MKLKYSTLLEVLPQFFVLLLTVLPAQEPAGGSFVSLFNGKDLAGWQNVNCAPGTWSVRDGMIVCTGKPTGVLRSERQYENFILELEWLHVFPKGNSGLFIWSDPITAKGQPFTRAIECQVLDGQESENYTSHGDVFAIHGAEMKPDRPHPAGWSRCLPSERRSKPAGEWNHYRVTAVDGRLKLAVNGKEVSGGYDISPRKGYVCLESEGSEVHFRDIKIQVLPASKSPLKPEQVAAVDEGFRPLYTGVDFAGWKLGKEHEGHWKASNWLIDFDGQGSSLWSEKEYGDFTLIVDWRWTGKPVKKKVPVVLPDGKYDLDAGGNQKMVEVEDAGDSGIYLRGSEKGQVNIWCWPVGSGEVYGYRTDQSLPDEVRAAVTPKVKADAPLGEWNRFVITARGDRLTVELNGTTVIENARLPGVPARGPIALQQHGSPIQFANLYVKETPGG
jgi:hypothetical protein